MIHNITLFRVYPSSSTFFRNFYDNFIKKRVTVDGVGKMFQRVGYTQSSLKVYISIKTGSSSLHIIPINI